MSEQFNIKDFWDFLSSAMKNRWWKETDYNKKSPSEELKQAIISEAMTKFSEADSPK
ncbi:MAG: hypothetical protein WBF99_12370 [Xanthobacteraceae bacterium]